MGSILAKMAVQLIGQTAQFNTAMDTAARKLTNFEKLAVGAGRTIGATLGGYFIYQGLDYGIGVMKDFEKQMSEVQALSGATGAEFEQLRNNAINLAGAFKAIDIARMETELSRLGFTTGEILDSTKAVIDLARATGEDLAKSADIAGSTLKAFGLEASESGRVAEAMAIGLNTSALALDNFGEAMKYVAPVARQANFTLEQTTALLGVLADNGIRGSMAGTSLRKIISDLGEGDVKTLNKRLREMAAAGLSGADAMSEVGRTAYAALLILANNTDQIDKANEAQMTMKGTLEATAKVITDNLQGDVDKLSAAWDGMFISGSASLPVFRALTVAATDFVKAISGRPILHIGDEFDQLSASVIIARKQVDGLSASTGGFFSAISGASASSTSPTFRIDQLSESIKRLEEAAEKGGYKVGYVWDEAGKKIERVFKIFEGGVATVDSAEATLKKAADFLANPFGPKDIKESFERSVGFLKKEIDELEKKIESSSNKGAIDNYRRQIIKLQNEIDKLLGKTRELKIEIESKPIKASEDPADYQGALGSGGLPFTFEVDEETLKAVNKELKEGADWFDTWRAKGIAATESMGKAFVAVGDAIGDALEESIRGGDSFLQALSKQTAQVINFLYKQYVAYVLTKAAKDSLYKPGPALIQATIAYLAARALFATLSKPESSPGSSVATPKGRMNLVIDAQFTGDAGKFIKAKARAQDRIDSRTYAG